MAASTSCRQSSVIKLRRPITLAAVMAVVLVVGGAGFGIYRHLSSHCGFGSLSPAGAIEGLMKEAQRPGYGNAERYSQCQAPFPDSELAALERLLADSDGKELVVEESFHEGSNFFYDVKADGRVIVEALVLQNPPRHSTVTQFTVN
ncbi:hypothetical protein LWF01_16165 [Saxibacter everestensis]|uniref:PepSY domain-containing protein n=1 Tax=Saxibacter everestensis TaxID=2909229 RepID=A0ABY8QYR9_9MICO|nr:hypothetical protein LWF01_16165 [Brevibacteriaceae bacterium ZFBP1038]